MKYVEENKIIVLCPKCNSEIELDEKSEIAYCAYCENLVFINEPVLEPLE
jgi:DNA-directed RNA polymerase subunit RPC12/RpoP